MSMYKAKILSNHKDIIDILPKWREWIDQNTSDFYQNPDIVIWRVFNESSDVKLCLIIVEENDKLKCVSPFIFQSRKIPFQFGIIKLFSLKTNQLVLLGNNIIISQASDQKTIFKTVFKALQSISIDYDIIRIENITTKTILYEYIFEKEFNNLGFKAVKAHGKIEKNWILDLSSTFDDYIGGFQSKKRLKLKNEVKKLSCLMEAKECIIKIDKPEQVTFLLAVGVTSR